MTTQLATFCFRACFRASTALVALCVVVLLSSEALGCPTCKDGLAENDPQQQAMAAGYFYSILFMMSMPFLLLATIGGFAYRAIKRSDQLVIERQAVAAQQQHA